jgi:hypothetical protein
VVSSKKEEPQGNSAATPTQEEREAGHQPQRQGKNAWGEKQGGNPTPERRMPEGVGLAEPQAEGPGVGGGGRSFSQRISGNFGDRHLGASGSNGSMAQQPTSPGAGPSESRPAKKRRKRSRVVQLVTAGKLR